MLIIITVALAALYEFGIFNNNPTYCTLSSNVQCPVYTVYANGTLQVSILQTTGNQINVTGIACTQNASIVFANVQSGTISSGSNAVLSVQCNNQYGLPYSGSSGSVYQGSLAIKYIDSFTGYPTTIYGKISSKVS